jgi:hypothetical protein
MVLVAATALTIFSLLGSAAITGLIPTVPYAKQGLLQDINENKPSNHTANFETNFDKKTPINNTESKTPTANNQGLMGVDDNKKHQALSDTKLCHDCGVIISIKSINQVSSDIAGNLISGEKDMLNARTAYLIKVRMENGGYRLVTQYSQPQHSIGDIVKLDSNQLVNA